MEKVKLGGFDLDEVEMQIISKIIEKHAKRIEDKMGLDELKLDLKKKKHGKTYLHQISGSLKIRNRNFNSEITDYNLLKAISQVMDKLGREAEHKLR